MPDFSCPFNQGGESQRAEQGRNIFYDSVVDREICYDSLVLKHSVLADGE